MLDLPPAYDAIDLVRRPTDTVDSLAPWDLTDDHVSFAHSGTAIVSFSDRPWFPSSQESPAVTFPMVDVPASQYIVLGDAAETTHSVSLLRPDTDIFVDSGSTINTAGSSTVLTSYVSPSLAGIVMRSATGQVVKPAGKGRFPLEINSGQGSLSVLCQHTPAITSSIFSLSPHATRSTAIVTS
jgi:hypothetical protein